MLSCKKVMLCFIMDISLSQFFILHFLVCVSVKRRLRKEQMSGTFGKLFQPDRYKEKMATLALESAALRVETV